jgi:hypothetical protein
MTFAEALAAVDRDSRDDLVEDIEDALDGHNAAEVFLAMAYFLAVAIKHLPCSDLDAIIDGMPTILRSVIAHEADTVTLQ